MRHIIKIAKSLENCGLLIKSVAQTIEYTTKEQRDEFLGMLLDALGPNLFVNMFAGKGVIRTCN